MSDIAETLRQVLTEDFDVPTEEIKSARTLEELDVDSVAAVELADIMRERLNVTVKDDQLTTTATFEQVCETLREVSA